MVFGGCFQKLCLIDADGLRNMFSIIVLRIAYLENMHQKVVSKFPKVIFATNKYENVDF